MAEFPTCEDHRGVDIGQIRRQLRMSVPERVRSMVHTANVMLAVQQTARASRGRNPDLTFAPSGGLGGFDEWNAKATVVDIAESVSVHVAALGDIIASKQAANRPKDQRALPYLESLREQLGETNR